MRGDKEHDDGLAVDYLRQFAWWQAVVALLVGYIRLILRKVFGRKDDGIRVFTQIALHWILEG